MNRLLLIFLLCLPGCTSYEEGKDRTFEEVEVRNSSIIISEESLAEYKVLGEIKAVSDGLLVYDSGMQSILKFDFDGNKLFSFGREGHGPGEFSWISDFWEFEDYYLLYDINHIKFMAYDFEGNWIEDFPIELDEVRPTRIEVINPNLIITSARGRGGFLLTSMDLENQESHHFGKAVDEFVVDNTADEIRQAVQSRRVPEYLRNNVRIGQNETGIFSFQQTTGLLEKYSHSGDLIWSKSLIIPAAQELFDRMFDINLDRYSQGLSIQMGANFNYAWDIHVDEQGIAVLLNLNVLEEPVTVVWVPNNGVNATIVSFPEIENRSDALPRSFTISSKQSYIYFTDDLDKIYRAEWPVNTSY